MTRWIRWMGGPRPVPAKTWVEVRLRDRTRMGHDAGKLRWKHRGTEDDIVAYRILHPEDFQPQASNH